MNKVGVSNRGWMIASLLTGLVFLLIALRQTDLTAVLDSLSRVSLGWSAVVLACGMAFIATKTLRWAFILKPILVEKFNLLHLVVYIGTAANLVIAHTGELLRIALLARRNDTSSSAVLATIGLERTLDFVALIVLIGLALVIDPRVSSVVWSAGLISLGLVAVGVTVVLALLNTDSRVSAISKKLLAAFPARIRKWLTSILIKGRDGLGSMRRPGTVVMLIAISVFQWCWIVAAIWACAQAAGVDIPVSGAIAVLYSLLSD